MQKEVREQFRQPNIPPETTMYSANDINSPVHKVKDFCYYYGKVTYTVRARLAHLRGPSSVAAQMFCLDHRLLL